MQSKKKLLKPLEKNRLWITTMIKRSEHINQLLRCKRIYVYLCGSIQLPSFPATHNALVKNGSENHTFYGIVQINRKYVASISQRDCLAAIIVVVLRMMKHIFDIFRIAADFWGPNLRSVEVDLWFLHF